ncbi:hypothetical protein J6590_041631 [Homalodisca vitripennis]|nr:hypothetical protein J6590_041631 [Homalodisca vitripennis]
MDSCCTIPFCLQETNKTQFTFDRRINKRQPCLCDCSSVQTSYLNSAVTNVVENTRNRLLPTPQTYHVPGCHVLVNKKLNEILYSDTFLTTNK